MSNLITDRIAYFLKDYPPFDRMDRGDLNVIASKTVVRYYKPDESIFNEGNAQSGFCFILNQGNIKLLRVGSMGEELIDQCEPGDIFGVRSIITQSGYSMTARSVEESLVYAFPKEVFEKLFNTNAEFSNYFASGYAAGQIVVRGDQANSHKPSLISPKIAYTKKVVTCTNESIEAVAKKMSEHGVGSIVIIDENNFPIGIVTDTDLRNKVLAKGKNPSESINEIMSSPVKTVKDSITVSEVMMEMIKTGVHHLVVTKKGTEKSQVCGIISDHDVIISQQNHPASLLKSIKKSNEPSEWKLIRDKVEVLLSEYLSHNADTSLASTLITKINDTIIEKAVNSTLEKFPESKAINFCWLNLGSEGREEQLLRTDQDNAIVFEDTRNNEKTQALLLNVASEVNSILIECGFKECPAEIMARNPDYCQPLTQWKSYFDKWINAPDPRSVMNCTIFFDYRLGYGNQVLIEELNSHIINTLDKNELFLNFLAKNSLQNPPPLSFFKNFLLEKGGEHKNEFDIKKRAMMPLADAARLLLLDHGEMGIQNTVKRYQRLAEIEPKSKDLFETAAKSYEIFMSHRAKNGLEKEDSGQFIDLDRLTKLEKQILKNAFVSIKEIQDLVKVRFQQVYFN